MENDLRSLIERLVSLYETQKERADQLEAQLAEMNRQNDKTKEKIELLTRENDNLKLRQAFSPAGGSNREAKAAVNELIGKIDKCISLIES